MLKNAGSDAPALEQDRATATSPSGYTYFKADQPKAGASFAQAVRLSGDGNTLVIGAPDTNHGAGEVYVMRKQGNTWSREVVLGASNAESGDHFGASISVSIDGNTVVVGAPDESSSKGAIFPNEFDNEAKASGAVYSFVRAGARWQQEAYLKDYRPDPGDRFGLNVVLSPDGNTLAVSIPCKYAEAANPCQSMPQWIGVVHVFAHYARGRTWDFAGATPQGPNKRGAGWGAESIALSGDGTIIAVAERGSNALSVTPGAGSGGIAVCARSGRVVFYAREEFGVYELKTTAALDTGNSQRCGLFGAAISLSHDGTQLAVLENDLDTGNRSAARVHVYQSSQAIWKASSTVEIAREVDAPSRAFGTLSLSADAHTFALGDASWRKGLGGTALVYTRNGAEWAQAKSYHLGAPEQDDAFGVAVSLSANGKTLAVGAPHEDGRIGGIGGDELNDKAENSGAAYVYER